MIKFLLNISLTLLLATSTLAQNPGPNVAWQKCFSTTGEDTFHALKQLDDGNYLATLWFQNRDNFLSTDTSAGYYLVKFDHMFNVIWKHYIPLLATKIIVLPNKEIILGGLTGHSTNKGNIFPNIHGDTINQFPDVGVIKYDSTGQNVIWAFAYGSSGDESNLYDMISTSDNGFLLTSITRGNDGDIPNRACYSPFDYGDAFILKIDSIGQKKWIKVVGGSGGDACLGSIIVNGQNEYIIPVFSTSEDCDFEGTQPFQSSLLNFRQLWIVLNNDGLESKRILDETGKLNYEQKKAWKRGNRIYSIGFNESKIAYSPTYPFHDNWDATINVFDDSLNLIKQKLFGGKGFDLFLDHIYDEDGNHIFWGKTNSSDALGDIPALKGTDWDHWILKTDTNFNIIWSRTIGGNGRNTNLFSKKQEEILIDGSNLIVATHIYPPKNIPSLDLECGLFFAQPWDTNKTSSDAWVIKLDLTTGIEIVPTKDFTQFKLFPNPTSNIINIHNSSPTQKQLKIIISNELGQVVKESKFEDSGNNSIPIDELTNGIYFVSIYKNKKKLFSQKIIVRK